VKQTLHQYDASPFHFSIIGAGYFYVKPAFPR
jgi:hypothetical protein